MTTRQSKILRIDAQPEPLTIDAAKTAVLVIDMQNDFGAEGGMFHRAGIDIAPIKAAVPPTARVLAAARAAAIPAIYVKMEFRPDLSDVGAPDSPNRRKHAPLNLGMPVAGPGERKGRILIRDTWNTEIVPELAPKPGDIVVSKHRFSAFFETDLDMILRSLGVSSLIVTGCTTSVCVEFDHPRRDVPRLRVPAASRLHGGARGRGPAAQQPRRILAGDRGFVRLDRNVGGVPGRPRREGLRAEADPSCRNRNA